MDTSNGKKVSRRRYPEHVRLAAARMVLDQGKSLAEVMRYTGASKFSVYNWVKQEKEARAKRAGLIDSAAVKIGDQPFETSYPIGVRQRAVQMVLDENFSQPLVCSELNVAPGTLSKWVAKERKKRAEQVQQQRDQVAAVVVDRKDAIGVGAAGMAGDDVDALVNVPRDSLTLKQALALIDRLQAQFEQVNEQLRVAGEEVVRLQTRNLGLVKDANDLKVAMAKVSEERDFLEQASGYFAAKLTPMQK